MVQHSMLWHIPQALQDNVEFAAIFEPFKHALVQVALPWIETFQIRQASKLNW